MLYILKILGQKHNSLQIKQLRQTTTIKSSRSRKTIPFWDTNSILPTFK